jgi:hypothetical protein
LSEPLNRVTVLGTGPVGLAVALALAHRGGARLVTNALPRMTDPPRVDMVPSGFLALLLELGVLPAQIGVTELHDTRHIAWDASEPETIRGGAVAYIERPALDLALLAALERTTAAPDIVPLSNDFHDPSEHMIDASGRRAITATRINAPTDPWIARVFSRRGVFTSQDQAFRMAALPGGYVYRVATGRLLVIGVVLARSEAEMRSDDIARYICDAGAGWLLHGVGALNTMGAGKGGVASVQWCEGPDEVWRAGDASLARDSLSAQGIAAGVADAVALARGEIAATDWGVRQAAQLRRHLSFLAATLARSRFHQEPAWCAYKVFLRHHGVSTSDGRPR